MTVEPPRTRCVWMRLMVTGNDESSYLKLYHLPKMLVSSARLEPVSEPIFGEILATDRTGFHRGTEVSKETL